MLFLHHFTDRLCIQPLLLPFFKPRKDSTCSCHKSFTHEWVFGMPPISCECLGVPGVRKWSWRKNLLWRRNWKTKKRTMCKRHCCRSLNFYFANDIFKLSRFDCLNISNNWNEIWKCFFHAAAKSNAEKLKYWIVKQNFSLQK